MSKKKPLKMVMVQKEYVKDNGQRITQRVMDRWWIANSNFLEKKKGDDSKNRKEPKAGS